MNIINTLCHLFIPYRNLRTKREEEVVRAGVRAWRVLWIRECGNTQEGGMLTGQRKQQDNLDNKQTRALLGKVLGITS
jgi:hypothetical protein